MPSFFPKMHVKQLLVVEEKHLSSPIPENVIFPVTQDVYATQSLDTPF